MALLHMEGFDWWEDDDDQYMVHSSGSSSNPSPHVRLGAPSNAQLLGHGNDVDYAGRCRVRFVPQGKFRNEVIVGYVHRWRYAAGRWYGFGIGNEDGFQIRMQIQADTVHQIWRGPWTTMLWRSDPGLIAMSQWNHYEMRLKCDNTSGEVEFRLNGQQLCNLTGIDTQAQSGSDLCFAYFGWTGKISGKYNYFDDVYILDKLGSTNNDFLGPAPYVTTYHPSGAGTFTEWQASAGSNWDCVDDGQNISTADYVMVSGDLLVDGKRDTYIYDTLDNWEPNDEIYGVIFNECGISNTCSGEALSVMYTETEFVNSGENLVIDTRPDGPNTVNHAHVFEKNPSGETAWTETALNNAEFGIKYKAP